jgi:hypothetical protein
MLAAHRTSWRSRPAALLSRPTGTRARCRPPGMVMADIDHFNAPSEGDRNQTICGTPPD